MNVNQARGYVFERVIMNLMSESDYIEIKSGKLKGRGAMHQIDAFGRSSFPTPFLYPIRLIAEGKYYQKEIGLPTIRNFVGVLKDISEYYIVGEKGKRNTPNRYSDTGCLFSVSPFSPNAQNYAWAHNILLVSFTGIPEMDPIIDDVNNFVNGIPEIKLIKMTKKRLLTLYDDYKRSHIPKNVLSLVVGIIDNIYPVILVGENQWIHKIQIPSQNDLIQGEKVRRETFDYYTIFSLMLDTIAISFNLPNEIARKLKERIDRTTSGNKIFEIDIPLISKKPDGFMRRILKLNIYLPDSEMNFGNNSKKRSNKTKVKKNRFDLLEI